MVMREQASTARAGRHHVLIAGVPWPMYKLQALSAGLITFILIGAFTLSVSTAMWVAVLVTIGVWALQRWHYVRGKAKG